MDQVKSWNSVTEIKLAEQSSENESLQSYQILDRSFFNCWSIFY